MNIAELFVRIRGDTTDLHRKLTDAERDLLRLEKGSTRLDGALRGTHLSTGRLGNQFANLAGRIARVHPIVGNLANVLGDFAVGAGLTVGVLAGVAAIAVAYDKLTESTRKAKEEQDKLIDALQKSIHLKGLGPGGETVDQVKAAKARADAIKVQITTLEGLIVKDAQDADVIASNLAYQQKINALYIERQNLLNTEAGGQSIVNEKVQEAIDANTKKTKEMTFGFNELRDAAARVNAEILKERTDWWKNYIEKTNEALTLTEQLQREIMATRPSIAEVFHQAMVPPPFEMPQIQMPFEGLTDTEKDSLRQLGVLTDKTDKNANKISDAIWGSAAQLGNVLVSALNIGGGGRGSNLGGAIGGTIGFVAGSIFGGGPIGGAIGSTIGNLAGSLFGGLFDHHKKAVDTNTQALRANTAALLLSAPTGFKVEPYRFDATYIQHLQRDIRRYNTRGGALALAGT